MRSYFVYIMTNNSGTLYTGVTNDLERRAAEHKAQRGRFTSKYKINRVVYCETFRDITDAIEREKQIKSWRRRKKLDLIEAQNPQWRDLLEQ